MGRFTRLFISTTLLVGMIQVGMPLPTDASSSYEGVRMKGDSGRGLSFKAIKEDGVRSGSDVIVQGATSPSSPVVNDITDQTTLVSGKVAPRSKVTLKIGTKTFGPVVASGTGEFEIIIDRPEAGMTAVVVTEDAEGNVSGETTLMVKDVTPPEAPQVDEVTDALYYVTGRAEPGTTVVVKNQTSIKGTSVADKDGHYEIPVYSLEANLTLNVTAMDASNNISKATTMVVKDVLAPATPSVFFAVTDKTTLIKGRAYEGSVVFVKVGEKEIGSSFVYTEGGYEVEIPPQKGGTRLRITAVDRSDNVSQATEIIVKDTTPPPPPVVHDVSDHSAIVSGSTEPEATVIVGVGKKIIGKKSAGKDGKYVISIAKQKSGTELLVQSTDKSGNAGLSRKIVVLDETPPSVPTMNPVSDQSTTINGRAEIDAKVFIKVGSNVIGSVIAKKGSYSIKIFEQKAGTKLTVHAVDGSGNQSQKRQVTVQDRTPPTISSLNKLTRTGGYISGKAEAYAKITIFRGTLKIGEGTADGNGNFKVKVDKQKSGSTLTIRAQDKVGNKSKDKTIRVT